MSVFARVVGEILAVPGGLNSRLLFILFMCAMSCLVMVLMPRGWRVKSWVVCHMGGEKHHELLPLYGVYNHESLPNDGVFRQGFLCQIMAITDMGILPLYGGCLGKESAH